MLKVVAHVSALDRVWAVVVWSYTKNSMNLNSNIYIAHVSLSF